MDSPPLSPEAPNRPKYASFFADSQVPASQALTQASHAQRPQEPEDDVVDEDVIDIDDTVEQADPAETYQDENDDDANSEEENEENAFSSHHPKRIYGGHSQARYSARVRRRSGQIER